MYRYSCPCINTFLDNRKLLKLLHIETASSQDKSYKWMKPKGQQSTDCEDQHTTTRQIYFFINSTDPLAGLCSASRLLAIPVKVSVGYAGPRSVHCSEWWLLGWSAVGRNSSVAATWTPSVRVKINKRDPTECNHYYVYSATSII